jgi:hypothetical protein
MFELHEQMLYDMNQRLNCYTIECKLKLEILKLYQPYDDIPIFKAETNVKDLIV